MFLSNLFKKKQKITDNFQADWLIAGLGNPGLKYDGNRHNIGWMVTSAVCKKFNVYLKETLIYFFGKFEIFGQNVILAIPTTFMNNSGEAIVKIAKQYNIPVNKIVIIVDEYNFPVGKIHLKDTGNDGGHNGVASVIEHLESNKFLRLRCGIGNKFSPGNLVNYVLSDFDADEIEERDNMIQKAVDSLTHLIKTGNINRAMSEINSGKLWE